jgi:hypothetical protein
LKFARRVENGWSEAQTITSGSSFFVNWAGFPSLLPLQNGLLAAHWLQKSGKGVYAYHVMVSVSRDAGKTWTKPVSPHSDRSENEHGFVSLVDQGQGSFAAFWLDARNFKMEAGEHDGEPDSYFTVANSTAARSSGFPRMVQLGNHLFITWTYAGSNSWFRVARLIAGGMKN